PRTITLTTGPILVSKDMVINGAPGGKIQVSGNHASNVFTIASGAIVVINGLTLLDGAAADGGAVQNAGQLTLRSSTVANNGATNSGGGLWNGPGATLTVLNSTITGNTSIGDGGAIKSVGTSLSMTNVTVADNSSLTGPAVSFTGAATVGNSIVAGNTS